MQQRSVQDKPLKVVGSHTTIADLSAAVALTVPATARVLMIQPFAQNVRMTLDGTTPEAAVGFQIAAGEGEIAAGDVFQIAIHADETIKLIEETASATAQYQWWR